MQGISVIFDDINMALPNEKDRLHNLKIVDNIYWFLVSTFLILFNDSLVTSPNKLGVRKSRKFDFGFSGFDTYFIP